MNKYPRCKVCGKITEKIGLTSTCQDARILFGCRTPEICGYTEYTIDGEYDD